mmetsp:Transcript_18130/g.46411  ORF Transcript_18130/g.46411 Transcript_18130/m.46411 type:complete len:270 (-) Transcript_18130:45-854(-)
MGENRPLQPQSTNSQGPLSLGRKFQPFQLLQGFRELLHGFLDQADCCWAGRGPNLRPSQPSIELGAVQGPPRWKDTPVIDTGCFVRPLPHQQQIPRVPVSIEYTNVQAGHSLGVIQGDHPHGVLQTAGHAEVLHRSAGGYVLLDGASLPHSLVLHTRSRSDRHIGLPSTQLINYKSSLLPQGPSPRLNPPPLKTLLIQWLENGLEGLVIVVIEQARLPRTLKHIDSSTPVTDNRDRLNVGHRRSQKWRLAAGQIPQQFCLLKGAIRGSK